MQHAQFYKYFNNSTPFHTLLNSGCHCSINNSTSTASECKGDYILSNNQWWTGNIKREVTYMSWKDVKINLVLQLHHMDTQTQFNTFAKQWKERACRSL